MFIKIQIFLASFRFAFLKGVLDMLKVFCIGLLIFSSCFLVKENSFGETTENKEVTEGVVKEKKESCCDKDKLELKSSASGFQKLPKIPDIVLMNQNGKPSRISDILKDKITVINFIYTSCTSVCQILTSNFRQLEKALENIDKENKVQLISISIDPETDTPARLLQYATKQRIDLEKWTLLVGGLNSVERFSRSLGFSNIDKATHAPGVVIWDDIDKSWQRFVGITPPHVLSKEISKLSAINN